MNLYRRINKK